MKRYWVGLWIGWLVLLGTVPAGANTITILNVTISPRILLELYRAFEQGRGLTMVNPQVLLLNAKNDGEEQAQWSFDMVIQDGRNWVARVEFQAPTLRPGLNQYNAKDISGENSRVEFNRSYLPSTDLQRVLSGNIMPIGNYKVVFKPRSPHVGRPLVMSYGLFIPQSALNRPPVPIFPRNVAINTVLPTFSWTHVENASEYEVWVGPDKNPEVNTYWRSPHIKETQTMYASNARALENGVQYYWQVRAFDAFGRAVGGSHSRSQPAWFVVHTTARSDSTVSPAEADRVVRSVLRNPQILDVLKDYQAVGVETTSQDLANLLRQLQDGSSKISSAQLE